ncbi:reverse transcriptase domain-containing protein, partial [Tanacetum coccineum]
SYPKCTKKGDFRWTTAAEEAFTQLKQHIAALPTLVAPRPGDELIMYLSATHGAISAMLLTDRDSVQTPVYFVSKALKETEINYSAMEKLILALVISKPDASGRLQKWSVLLGEHNISYRPCTAVKGQILADFLIEKPETDVVLPQREVKLQDPWILLTDGSSCVDGSGAGLILTNPEGMEFTYALRFEFSATNNEAEYEALIAGLRIAARMGVRNLEANVDSRLVANHVLGEYVAKEDNMIQYLDKTKSLIQGFDRFTIRQVPRGDNKKADALSRLCAPRDSCGFMQYALRTTICSSKSLTVWVLLAHHAPRCNDCQVHRPIPRQPQQELTPITSPWPFHKWGIDIAGPFPVAAGGLKFLIVAIDYFTKWIEARAVATITGNQVKRFVWDNIVCRFGLPGEIVSDNGKQFCDNPFKDWSSPKDGLTDYISASRRAGTTPHREHLQPQAVPPLKGHGLRMDSSLLVSAH